MLLHIYIPLPTFIEHLPNELVGINLSLNEQTKRKNTMAAPKKSIEGSGRVKLFIYIQQSFIKHLLNVRHGKRGG